MVSLLAVLAVRDSNVSPPSEPAAPTAPTAVDGRHVFATMWPRLYGRTGPYGIANTPQTVTQISDLADDGHTEFLTWYRGERETAFNAEMSAHPQLNYVTDYIWQKIYTDCLNAGSFNPDRNAALQARILADVRAFLLRDDVRRDRHLVGYLVLDDYKGAMRRTLELIAAEVHSAAAPFPRPTIALFGGLLAYRATPEGPLVYDNEAYFDHAVTNYSPAAADIVGLYPYWRSYAGTANPVVVDWSMSTVLPHMLTTLKEVGMERSPTWNPSTLAWFGMLQAFGERHWMRGGYGTPTYEDVLTQAAAYLGAGSSALWFYSWDDGSDNYYEVSNDPALRQAVKDAAAKARAVLGASPTGGPQVRLRSPAPSPR